MAKRSKWSVELDKKIQKKFWRALTPTDRDMSRGTEDRTCPVCTRYGILCDGCPFNQFKKLNADTLWRGCEQWRLRLAQDYFWYDYSLRQGQIPQSARPLFHKFYREFRKKIRDYIEWV